MRRSIPGQKNSIVEEKDRMDDARRGELERMLEPVAETPSPVVKWRRLPPEQVAAITREKAVQSIRNDSMEQAAEFMSDLDVTAKQICSIHEKFLKGGVGGRKMTEEVVLEILNRICRGETLKRICVDVHMPSYGTVQKWYATDPDFQKAMDDARTFQMNLFADEILEIADNSVGDIRLAYDKLGNLVPEVNYENVKRSELKIKARQWLMEKMHKKMYGKAEPNNLPAVSASNGQLNIQIVLPDNGRDIRDVATVDL